MGVGCSTSRRSTTTISTARSFPVSLTSLWRLCSWRVSLCSARERVCSSSPGAISAGWHSRGWASRNAATTTRLRSLSQAERALSTRNVSLQTLHRDRWSAFWWGLGVIFGCVYCLVIALTTQQAFYRLTQETPLLQQLFFDTPINTNAAMLGTFLFTFMPALVVAFALTLALKWAADLENGRLEVLFSTPQSRGKVLLERFGANVLVVLLAPILTWLVILIVAQLAHLAVDQGRIFAASFNMFPMALITLGLVYALAGRLRYAALVSLLSAYIVLSYIEELFEGALRCLSGS